MNVLIHNKSRSGRTYFISFSHMMTYLQLIADNSICHCKEIQWNIIKFSDVVVFYIKLWYFWLCIPIIGWNDGFSVVVLFTVALYFSASIAVTWCHFFAHLVYQPKRLIQSWIVCHCCWHCSALASTSMHTSPWHLVRCRNFIFCIHMHICPPHMHIKYLVILTCSF